MNTKRSFTISIVSMIVCLALFIGATFAWFNDSVQSGNNQIQAGNLDIKLLHSNKYVTQEKEVVVGTNGTKLFRNSTGGEIKWEPGVMVYENFTVENVGSLALKYKFNINVAGFNTVTVDEETKSLKDVLKVAFIDRHFDGDRAKAINDLQFVAINEVEEMIAVLNAGTEGTTGQEYAMLVYWQPTANDNVYNLNNKRNPNTSNQEALFIDLGVKLNATQYTVESDSFDENYDKNAWKKLEQNERMEALVNEGYTAVKDEDSLNQITSESEEPLKIVMADGFQTNIQIPGYNKTVTIAGSSIVDFNGNVVYTKKGSGNGLRVDAPDGNVTLRNAEFASEVGQITLGIKKADRLIIENCNFKRFDDSRGVGNMVQFNKEQSEPMDVVFRNCTFDSTFVEFTGEHLNYNVRFENCKFVWNSKNNNGNVFIKTGVYASGNYSFDNCEFEYSGYKYRDNSLMEFGYSDGMTNINLNNIKVIGSGDNKSYVVAHRLYSGDKKIHVSSTGTNTYTFNGEEQVWNEVVQRK